MVMCQSVSDRQVSAEWNTQLLVLGFSRLHPCSGPGVAGELYLARCRSWLGRGITESGRICRRSDFVANPFAVGGSRDVGSGGRLYRTGDVVSSGIVQGELEYVGRSAISR